MSMNVQIRGSRFGVIAEVDEVAGYLVTIDPVHHHVHEGRLFSTTHIKEALGASNSTYMLLRAGANNVPHFEFTVNTAGAARIDMFEGPTLTDDGTPLTEVNHDRSSSNTSDVSVFSEPTVSADGTLLLTDRVPSGVAGAKAGLGNVSGRAEWLLAPSTDYLIKITNQGNTAATVAASAVWYEEEVA